MNIEAGFSKITKDVQDILRAPLVSNLDTFHIWVLIGVILISLLIWGMILQNVSSIAE